MDDLTNLTITDVAGDGQLSIHTDGGWLITIESEIHCTTSDGTTLDLAGEEPGTAEALSPILTGTTIKSAQANESDGLTLAIATGARLAAPPDDDFEAWNIVGPQGQRTVAMPGGELAVWDAPTPED